MRSVLAVIAVLALSACATESLSPERVMLAPGIGFLLPTPADLGHAIEATQLVTGHYGDDTFVFEGRLSATPERVVLVSTDAMGRRAITIEWRPGRLRVERAPWVPSAVHPENILADIVLMYWPAAAIRGGLAGGGATFTDQATRRSILKDGRELIVITGADASWSGTTLLRNLGWGYDIEVRSVVTPP